MYNGQGSALGVRLETIFAAVPACRCAADIGTDHGRLAAALLLRGVCKKVIATDRSAGSLNKARALAQSLGLDESRLELRKGDGLRVLSPGEADVIIMAGFGGLNMQEVLEECFEIAKSAKTLVLSPARNKAELRAYLAQAGFAITFEDMCRENGRFYDVIRATPAQTPLPQESLGLEIGEYILRNGHPLLYERIEREKAALLRALRKVSGEGENAEKRRADILRSIGILEEAAKCRK